MITNWFKTKNVELQTEVVLKDEKVITSKDIQKDLHLSFEQVLAEFDLKESKETQIDDYKNQLGKFKLENKEMYDKIEKLTNLGFSSTPSATNSLQQLRKKEHEVNNRISVIQDEINKAEKLNQLTAEYTLKYPFYKFIDNNTMINIMNKYSLVLGEAFMYSREIPEENLEVISYFTKEIKESEMVKQLIEYSFLGGFSSSSNYMFQDKPASKSLRNLDFHINMGRYENVKREFTISKLKMIAPESHFTIPTFETRNYRGENIEIPIAKLNTKTRKFELSTEKLEENQAKIREVLDPIACLEVEGGYIVMTAWDEEADIPEIKTNMLN